MKPGTGDALRHAVSAAQDGNIHLACALAERGLADGGDVAALNAFLGMMCARAGEHSRAIAHLRTAHAARPDDVTIACNLIASLIEEREFSPALDVASFDFAVHDPSLRIARYRGFLAQTLGKFDVAVETYELVVTKAPADFESWNNLGNARQALGNHLASAKALRQAVTLAPSVPPIRLNLASSLVAGGWLEEAEDVLKSAAEAFSDDAKSVFELYVLYKRQGRSDDALEAIGRAAAREPDNADYQIKLGIELGLVMRVEEAETAFRSAIRVDPHAADAYLGLAITYEHGNRAGELTPLIALATSHGVDPGAIAFIRALELRRQQRFEDALASLSEVPPGIEPERTANMRGSLLDRTGRPADAFAAFKEANQLHSGHPSEPLRRAAELRQQIRQEVAMLNSAWVASWSPVDPPANRPAPTFLLGFPRSGTTLLDTILMGHPGAQVMEERPTLTHVQALVGGMEEIARLDEAGIIAARDRYFDVAGQFCDLARPGLLVDKSPLYLNKVPLIHRLFPEARFILAMRHPCDVLLSCFMSNFRLNAAMSNFLRLEDAAEFYDLTFRYWERARALMPIRVHTVTYEKMIEDSEAELRPLLAFLGLEWRDDVLDHRRTAAARGLITTASYAQVTEPIYKRAAGRWTRYRTQMQPVIPVLEPWVRKFGYLL